MDLEKGDDESQLTISERRGKAVALTELASIALMVAIVRERRPGQPTGFGG